VRTVCLPLLVGFVLGLVACGGSGGTRSIATPTEPLPAPPPPTTQRSLPPIEIQKPNTGASVRSPVRISGTANTFEATFILELRTGGRRLARRVVTATSGSGTRGTFALSVPFRVSEETPGEIVAYELSAANGKRIHTVRVPIGLLPATS
jgi:Immunoglobulin-like domain of bacterial spore germination